MVGDKALRHQPKLPDKADLALQRRHAPRAGFHGAGHVIDLRGEPCLTGVILETLLRKGGGGRHALAAFLKTLSLVLQSRLEFLEVCQKLREPSRIAVPVGLCVAYAQS